MFQLSLWSHENRASDESSGKCVFDYADACIQTDDSESDGNKQASPAEVDTDDDTPFLQLGETGDGACNYDDAFDRLYCGPNEIDDHFEGGHGDPKAVTTNRAMTKGHVNASDTSSVSSESSDNSDSGESTDGVMSDTELAKQVDDFYRRLPRQKSDTAPPPSWLDRLRSGAIRSSKERCERKANRSASQWRSAAHQDQQRRTRDSSLESERQLWRLIGGYFPWKTAHKKLCQSTLPTVCVAGDANTFMWFDKRRAAAAAFVVNLIRESDAEPVQLCVSVVYTHFIDAADKGEDDHARVPLLGISAWWRQRRPVQSRFVLADERLPGRRASGWNQGADDIVVHALQKWKRLHSLLQECVVCSRFFVNAERVMCDVCAPRHRCIRFLDGESEPRLQKSFSMREWEALVMMEEWSSQHQEDDDVARMRVEIV
jgi:hypothetical protein